MALFKMRDSWNVWRKKVDAALGGLVEPVKSEDVTYDNTDSGLTATNVQSAIDEVASDVGTNSDAITTANGKISTLEGKFEIKNFTKTTTSAGWLTSDIPFSNHVIPLYTSLPTKFVFGAKKTDADVWTFRITNYDFTPVVETEVTVYYIEV